MNDTKHIEARLERSLRNQVEVPRLGPGFDAAVWARIAAGESTAKNLATAPAPSRALSAARWISVVNVIGIASTIGITLYFALRAFGGIETPPIDLGVEVAVPAISDAMLTRILTVLGQVLGLAALLFGFSLTSIGRRLRASLG